MLLNLKKGIGIKISEMTIQLYWHKWESLWQLHSGASQSLVFSGLLRTTSAIFGRWVGCEDTTGFDITTLRLMGTTKFERSYGIYYTAKPNKSSPHGILAYLPQNEIQNDQDPFSISAIRMEPSNSTNYANAVISARILPIRVAASLTYCWNMFRHSRDRSKTRRRSGNDDLGKIRMRSSTMSDDRLSIDASSESTKEAQKLKVCIPFKL